MLDLICIRLSKIILQINFLTTQPAIVLLKSVAGDQKGPKIGQKH